MPKKLLIIILIVVIAGGTLLGYFWWQRSEKEKIESVRQVLIPSSLDPKNVIENAIELPYYSQWESKEEDPSLEESWERLLGIPSSGQGLIKHASAPWLKSYLKTDGTEVHEINEEVSLILYLHVCKYEKPELAEEAYNKTNTDHGFKLSVLEHVELKTKVGLPPVIEDVVPPYIKPEQFQQYLLQSNNFIIYAYGLKEAAEDVMIRVIDQYTTK